MLTFTHTLYPQEYAQSQPYTYFYSKEYQMHTLTHKNIIYTRTLTKKNHNYTNF